MSNPNVIMITQESVDYANQLVAEIPRAYENIALETGRLLTAYQVNEEYLGPHKQEILDIANTIINAIKEQDETILELKLVLLRYASMAQEYLDNKPKTR